MNYIICKLLKKRGIINFWQRLFLNSPAGFCKHEWKDCPIIPAWKVLESHGSTLSVLILALLQHGADPGIRNSEGKTALELAEGSARAVLSGEYRKEDLLEAARAGGEEKLASLLNPLNVNCHASDGRRSTPLHLAAGYNRARVVQLLLQHGADVHAKDKG